MQIQQGSTSASNNSPTLYSPNDEGGGSLGFDLINALVGFDNAENRMTELVAQINYFLTGIVSENYNDTLNRYNFDVTD